MKLVFSEDARCDPGILLDAAKAWEELYLHTIDVGLTRNIVAGIYCLYVAVELYLKAYIVMQDKAYANPVKLKSLQHSYQKMYSQIERLAPKDFTHEIMMALEKHNLLHVNVNDLKYPAAPQFWSMEDGIHQGKHAFASIFLRIEVEVLEKKHEWVSASRDE